MNQTPTKVVYLVICIMGIIALIGVSALCLSMFLKTYVDPAVLTAIISITSGAIGSLGTMLVSTRSQPAGVSDTTISTTMTTTPKSGVPTTATPTPVVVTNTTAAPVPTVET